jgi:hypothetical protein
MESQFVYAPNVNVKCVQESHPFDAFKTCWRFYSESGRRLGFSDYSRAEAIKQAERSGYIVTNKSEAVAA